MTRVLRPSLAILGILSAAGLALAFGPAAGTQAVTEPSCCPASTGQMMEAVKLLAGEWEMPDEQGNTIVGLHSRLTSAGNVLCETMFPGTPHEMVNMYHLDNGSLVVTHYCAIGNQPRMVYTPPKDGSHEAEGKAISFPVVLEFKYKDCTNLSDPDAMYMGGLKITIKDADHIVQDWTSYVKGQPSKDHMPSFELTRKAPARSHEAHGEHGEHDGHDGHDGHDTHDKHDKHETASPK